MPKKPTLSERLDLERCPHCMVHLPTLIPMHGVAITKDHRGGNERYWLTYRCAACGGAVVAGAATGTGDMDRHVATEIYPEPEAVHEDIPDPARNYLTQAKESLHAPDGAGMLAASAVDAMLKAKDYKKGWINDRINKAVQDHLITDDMGKWAHQVRIDANDPRHADEDRPHLEREDAERCVDFAEALAEIMFVLPARVDKGMKPKARVVKKLDRDPSMS